MPIFRQIKAASVLDEIEQDIGYLKAGDFGERNVHFELKNSFIWSGLERYNAC